MAENKGKTNGKNGSNGKEQTPATSDANNSGFNLDLRKMFYRLIGLSYLASDPIRQLAPCNPIVSKLHYGTTVYVMIDTAMQMKKAADENKSDKNDKQDGKAVKNVLLAGCKSVIWHTIATFAIPTFFYNQFIYGADYVLYNTRVPQRIRLYVPRLFSIVAVMALITTSDKLANHIMDEAFKKDTDKEATEPTKSNEKK